MPRKLTLTFRHASGPRCVVSLEENGAAVRVTYSLRHSAGIPGAVASAMLADWEAWGQAVTKCPDTPPVLPSGWR